MLGRDVASAAAAAGQEVIALSHAQLDVRDAGAVRAAVCAEHPTAVINCAAWTDVDGAERPDAREHALAVNGRGAGHVAGAAAAAGAWVVHISSDYVFDGCARRPYVESDPPAPLSVYGRSKLEGEVAVAKAAPDSHTIVRSSWLFGTGGRCFPQTILSLARERQRLAVVCDQVGSPTFTGHLARALIELVGAQPAGPGKPVDRAQPAGRRGHRCPLGIVHLAAAGQCSWFEFARATVAAAGERCEIVPCATSEYPRPARRPAYSVLGSQRGDELPSMPSWREGLAEYLRELAVSVR